MTELSIVTGTYNRFARLRGLVESVRKHVRRRYEIVVADGGSTDGTREWLAVQPDVVLVGERCLLGAVNAYNKAFALTIGKYVAHLNDDCVLLDDTLDVACDMLEEDRSIGEVALAFVDSTGAPQVNYIHMNGATVLYANFGVLPRELGESVGWWGNYLHTYGGDCELSFQVWNAGYKVVPLREKHILHYREQDELRRENVEADRFFNMWRGRIKKHWDAHTTATRSK
jgi:GT2 family glycosyltransferase